MSELFWALLSSAIWFALGFYFGQGFMAESLMKEAYSLGLAVECEGSRGYHWSCEND